MSTSIVRKLAAVGLAAGLTALASVSFAAAGSQPRAATPAFEQVDSITMFRGPHSWQVIDEDTVILWATPSSAVLHSGAVRTRPTCGGSGSRPPASWRSLRLSA